MASRRIEGQPSARKSNNNAAQNESIGSFSEHPRSLTTRKPQEANPLGKGAPRKDPDEKAWLRAREVLQRTEQAIKELDPSLSIVDSNQLLFKARVSPFDKPLSVPELTSAAEIESNYEISRQYLILLINRHKLLSPSKRLKGDREVYDFQQEDIARIAHYADLRDLGYKIGEIEDIMGNQDYFDALADDFYCVLHDWWNQGGRTAWRRLVESVIDVPGMEELEKEALYNMLDGRSFEQCADILNLNSTDDVRQLITKAQNRIGQFLFRLLFASRKAALKADCER